MPRIELSPAQTEKYQRWYGQLIERGRRWRNLRYKERHHIIPRSCGGSDDPGNLVDLTYREHFLAHWLLVKIYSGVRKRAMVHALTAMTIQNGQRAISSWQFDIAKRALADAVAERRIERAKRRRKREERALSWLRSNERAMSSPLGKIMDHTPWRAKRRATVVGAQEAVKEIIRTGLESSTLAKVGPSAATAYARIWLECSRPEQKVNQHRKKVQRIRFSEPLKQQMRKMASQS